MDPSAPLTKEEIDALLAQDLLPPNVANGLMPPGAGPPAPNAEIPPIVQPMKPPAVASDLIAPGIGGPKPPTQPDTYAALGLGPAMATPNGAPTPAGMMAAIAPQPKPIAAPMPQPAPVQPKPPVPAGPVGGAPPSPAAVSAMSKVYTPAQIAGFGLKAEEIAQAGQHNAALAEMQASKAGEDAETVQEALDVAQTKIAKMEQAEAERKQVKQAAIASLNTKWDELAKTEIDPDRYWNSKDTGEKVLATIGLILGGIGGGLQGTGQNAAMDALQANINRDVEAQKASFMAKSQAMQGKESVFRMMMSEFGDERMAEQATYATHWDMVSKQLQEIALTSQSNVTKENALYAKQFADNQVAQYVEGVQANAELSLKQMQAAAAAATAAKLAKRDEEIFHANLEGTKAAMAEFNKATGRVALLRPISDGPLAGMTVPVDPATGQPIPQWTPSVPGGKGPVPVKTYSGSPEGGIAFNGPTAYAPNAKEAKTYKMEMQKWGEGQKAIEDIKKYAKEKADQGPNADYTTNAKLNQAIQHAEKAGVAVPEDLKKGGVLGGDRAQQLIADMEGDWNQKKSIPEQLYTDKSGLQLGAPDEGGADEEEAEAP